MAYFQTKNPYLGNFWWVWQRKMLVYFMANSGLVYGHLVYLMVLVYFSRYVLLHQGTLISNQFFVKYNWSAPRRRFTKNIPDIVTLRRNSSNAILSLHVHSTRWIGPDFYETCTIWPNENHLFCLPIFSIAITMHFMFLETCMKT
jgi:hypothetical protein